MSEHAANMRDERLGAALASCIESAEQGGPVDRKRLVTAYPEFAEEIANYFACRERLDQLAAPIREIVAPATAPQQILGDFRIVREIGRGGMGIVYEAEQQSLRRRVALKILPFAAVLDDRRLQRFKNEALAAAQLKHPNIVSVLSVGCERGVHYYAMEYVEGQSLAEVVEQWQAAKDVGCSMLDVRSHKNSNNQNPTSNIQNPTSEIDTLPIAALSTLHTTNPREHFRQVARLGIQAAEALHYAHEMGIVHRDIKPSNLLVDAHGHLWITDFGLATTQTDASLTMTGDLLGTLRYMSPEQAAGNKAHIDYRTDIYSLGVTLFELLTLQPAFTGDDRQELLRLVAFEEPRKPRQINPRMPRDLETIVLKAIEKSPVDRYGTAQELADDLRCLVDDKPIKARPRRFLGIARNWARRNRPIVWSAAATLVFCTLIAAGSIGWIARDHRARRAYTQNAQGAYLFNEDKLEEAAACFRKAIAFDPDFTAAHTNLGILLTQQGKLDEAIAAFSNTINIDPSWSPAPNYMGHLYARLGRWNEAKEAFSRALELNPDHHHLWYEHACLLLYGGDVPAYRRACQQMLVRFSETDDLAIADRVAKTCLLLPDAVSDVARVLELADRGVAEKKRDHHWVTLTKGLAEFRTEKLISAVDWLNRVAGPQHCNATASSLLAMAYHRLGRIAEATAALANARDIIADSMPVPSRDQPYGDDWHDWVRAEIIFRQAEELLN
jgi:serine/threonine protein kinase/Flp pilus assembly protein TadD